MPDSEPSSEPSRKRSKQMCSICHDPLDNGVDHIKKLECHHEFHARCIGRWFTRGNNTCPLCRASFA